MLVSKPGYTVAPSGPVTLSEEHATAAVMRTATGHGFALAHFLLSVFIRDTFGGPIAMTFICLWSPSWSESSLIRFATSALKIAPKVAVDVGKGLIWADGRSLDSSAIARDLLTATEQYQLTKAQVAISRVPIAAELAARIAGPDLQSVSATTIVPFGGEGVELWRLSRADDMRPISASTPRSLP